MVWAADRATKEKRSRRMGKQRVMDPATIDVAIENTTQHSTIQQSRAERGRRGKRKWRVCDRRDLHILSHRMRVAFDPRGGEGGGGGGGGGGTKLRLVEVECFGECM